ncbi:WhiB family transcriptional regulator [Arthrobacter sp. FW306-05-C]|uniref:WhiB family transcriptional regulator n=1 Tax=Arthrobacter sp. FW306-05-C TaxID=2879620 RepID=UPI003FA46A76|nr:WhiB family transcriptional regulator [Arthrobacter sp. FW306-05-C]
MKNAAKLAGTLPRPHRQQLHAALIAAVTRHRHNVPCLTTAPGLDWLDPDPDTQQAAAALCDRCPALQACRRYAATTRRVPGTWAGTTEADRKQRRAKHPGSSKQKDPADRHGKNQAKNPSAKAATREEQRQADAA